MRGLPRPFEPFSGLRPGGPPSSRCQKFFLAKCPAAFRPFRPPELPNPRTPEPSNSRTLEPSNPRTPTLWGSQSNIPLIPRSGMRGAGGSPPAPPNCRIPQVRMLGGSQAREKLPNPLAPEPGSLDVGPSGLMNLGRPISRPHGLRCGMSALQASRTAVPPNPRTLRKSGRSVARRPGKNFRTPEFPNCRTPQHGGSPDARWLGGPGKTSEPPNSRTAESGSLDVGPSGLPNCRTPQTPEPCFNRPSWSGWRFSPRARPGSR